ncbi:hypothetical protein [Kineococcus arenarius]
MGAASLPLDRFEGTEPALPYAAGTWGPDDADRLAEPGERFLR